MKKFLLSILAAGVIMLPILSQAQAPSVTYVATSGVSFFTAVSAKATATSGAVRLPVFGGYGVLNVTGVGITGSPSGCSITLAYQQNNSVVTGSVVSTTSFTPAVSVQQFNVAPTIPAGDSFVAVYACSTYPTAGTLTVSFSPLAVASLVATVGDPCKSPEVATSSFSVNLSSATTTAVAAASTGKSVYVCQFTVAGTTGGTVQLEYGTGATCGTGTTALTGAIGVTTAQPVSMGWGGALVTAPASNALCLVTAGTSTAVTGFISYVQQ